MKSPPGHCQDQGCLLGITGPIRSDAPGELPKRDNKACDSSLVPPSRGQQRGITVLKKNGSSVTHKHLRVSPAKEHPTPSKCTNFSWHKSSCWHTGMSTLNLSVKALKKPENCLHKKPPLPRHDRSSPSKDAPRAAPRPCCRRGGWEERKVHACSAKDKIRDFF